MASPAKISSIKDIKERQLEIKQQLETSKEAAIEKLQTTSSEAKTVVLQDVILPAAGIALAGYVTVKLVDYFLSDGSQEQPAEAVYVQQQSPQPKAAPQVRNRPQITPPKQPFYQSILRLGSLLIPAGQAIMEVIKEERQK